MTGTLPAQMLGAEPQTPFSPELLQVLNGWATASHRRLTSVYAGAYLRDPARGAFFIFRQNYVWVTQKLDVVHVPGAGAVEITRAPLGPRLVAWAQLHGNLWFKGTKGIHGFLHLWDDSVTITHPPG